MKRIALLLSALWIFLVAVSPEQVFAAQLYQRIYGKPPPAPKQWEIVAHDQEVDVDGNPIHPIYTVDKKNKVVHAYFHEGQMAAWNSIKRFVFMLAGKQGGKTVYGKMHLLRWILEYGAGDYLVVSATNDLFIAKMLPDLKQLFVNEMGIARYWPGDRIFELCDPSTGEFGARSSQDHEKMWGRIILRTAESEEGMQSFSAKAALLDEAGIYHERVWKDVRARLSIAGGPALATTSLYDLTGWLKSQIYDLWMDEDPEIDVVTFESTKNPAFSKKEFESLRRTMPKHQFELDFMAKFGRPPAAIYEKFVDKLRDEDGGHKARRFVIPSEWPRMVAVDPGIVNPGKIWIAHDPQNDVYYIYRTEKGTRREDDKLLVRDDLKRRDAIVHATDDIQLARERGERVIWWAVGNKGEKYWRQDYKSAGALGIREPDTVDVEEGIDRVSQLIGQYRLFVFEDLHELTNEITSYSRVIKNGEVSKEIKDKATFHLMDALRYFAVQVVKPRLNWRVEDKVGRYA
jgi:hypothetical protein